jgi:hypothetical protein
MKTFLTTAAIVAALTLPAFAEGDTTGSEAWGEANGSFKLSKQDPDLANPILGSRGTQAMAQGRLPRAQAPSSTSISANSEGLLFTPASSGMDGGNRK